MVDGAMYTDQRGERPPVDVSPGVGRKGDSGGSVRSRTGSILHKFGSLRVTKKKAYGECTESNFLLLCSSKYKIWILPYVYLLITCTVEPSS